MAGVTRYFALDCVKDSVFSMLRDKFAILYDTFETILQETLVSKCGRVADATLPLLRLFASFGAVSGPKICHQAILLGK